LRGSEIGELLEVGDILWLATHAFDLHKAQLAGQSELSLARKEREISLHEMFCIACRSVPVPNSADVPQIKSGWVTKEEMDRL
jgi:hypothetical protein